MSRMQLLQPLFRVLDCRGRRLRIHTTNIISICTCQSVRWIEQVKAVTSLMRENAAEHQDLRYELHLRDPPDGFEGLSRPVESDRERERGGGATEAKVPMNQSLLLLSDVGDKLGPANKQGKIRPRGLGGSQGTSSQSYQQPPQCSLALYQYRWISSWSTTSRSLCLLCRVVSN
ncbi:uncharacterized protein BO88DRAFT_402638 [Aspergillus vadensis CBS 113365]|uniref:Uncharacterized protein n=1 Tax=Aspergillus vadensis (strain CBS 113365 / IMI 142717 / IBT 24658) TaxID=1448311 RepID=A0A319CW60_ASPVC|nr:hypothetical protein BO88DRAFT_402638 [Aspergillus vadensis CBS 113365]PYH72412.1 hypothetical protein BO88DRAFT_402638 [Aspergillus vadensis CBS 113365]